MKTLSTTQATRLQAVSPRSWSRSAREMFVPVYVMHVHFQKQLSSEFMRVQVYCVGGGEGRLIIVCGAPRSTAWRGNKQGRNSWGARGACAPPPPHLKIATAVLKSWFYVFYSISMPHFRRRDRCLGSPTVCVVWKFLASLPLFFSCRSLPVMSKSWLHQGPGSGIWSWRVAVY